MDGFHALGTQGRSHPRKTSGPSGGEGGTKSCSAARF